ncbi:ABC transporter ATP-binding protein [Caproiciproducens sp.]|uniref:ABC transporter ATP-binding protein n=1 Tax=Caproiciproducens sp. TaxID=1954376 RepID=UPI0028A0D1AD|nr:ATP-binding cassette domain-containing protein [Caproiciproducens sp.]
MAIIEMEQFSFTYPDEPEPTLRDISLKVGEGEFILLCGLSGCGKTTLLRQLKPALTPHGKSGGSIFFCGQPLRELDLRAQTADIGFVMQSPEAQIVTDKVWHELAFGLESLGLDNSVIRLRTAEMASFFGIEEWFEKDVSSLSGGQKQLLNLASVMAMQPKLLLLDEPTSQLDPIAAADFLAAVRKINEDLGVAVVLTEQRLQEVFPMTDRVIVLDSGRIFSDASPREAGAALTESSHPMAAALPAPMKIYGAVKNGLPCPMTVREGRQWLDELFREQTIRFPYIEEPQAKAEKKDAVCLKECWFSYDRNEPDVIKDLTLHIPQGELSCIVGGNGTGKSTALSIMAGIFRPCRGKVTVNGRTALLPQNPQSLFLKNTVGDDLAEVLDKRLSADEKKQKTGDVAAILDISHLLSRHPYDLSGGEQQRAALAKVLLTQPDILLLDEPTKGLDSFFKQKFADILKKLIKSGVTVVMVSHDIEFCAEFADNCTLFFNGTAIASNGARAFFAGNSFYTTAASRMTRGLFQDAVRNGDVIALCNKNRNAD